MVPGIRAGQTCRQKLAQQSPSGSQEANAQWQIACCSIEPSPPGRRAMRRTVPSPSTFHGRFGDQSAAWRRRHHRAIVIGWVGPLFWPYAYYDVVDYAFYPHSYDTFWPYAYDDVYQGVFGAYAYGYDEDDATVGRSSRPTGDTSVAQPPQPSGGVALCATQAATLTDWPIARIAQAVGPDDTQRAALDGLKEATTKSLAILQSNCPTALPSTPSARIAAMRQRLETMLQAVRTIRPALEAFYQQLNDEQKARFNAMGGASGDQDQQQARRDSTQLCGENASGVGHIPLKQIESSLQTNPSQRSVFEECGMPRCRRPRA